MIPLNAADESYDSFEILGKKGLFTNMRIDRSTIPDGLYTYDLRDCCDGEICELKDYVMVNHWGTVILAEPINGSAEGIPISEDDYGFLGETLSLSEFISEQKAEPKMTM